MLSLLLLLRFLWLLWLLCCCAIHVHSCGLLRDSMWILSLSRTGSRHRHEAVRETVCVCVSVCV